MEAHSSTSSGCACARAHASAGRAHTLRRRRTSGVHEGLSGGGTEQVNAHWGLPYLVAAHGGRSSVHRRIRHDGSTSDWHALGHGCNSFTYTLWHGCSGSSTNASPLPPWSEGRCSSGRCRLNGLASGFLFSDIISGGRHFC